MLISSKKSSMLIMFSYKNTGLMIIKFILREGTKLYSLGQCLCLICLKKYYIWFSKIFFFTITFIYTSFIEVYILFISYYFY